MSAIPMKCRNCRGHFITGVVGTTPWPPHVCPDGTTGAKADLYDPLTGETFEQKNPRSYYQELDKST